MLDELPMVAFMAAAFYVLFDVIRKIYFLRKNIIKFAKVLEYSTVLMRNRNSSNTNSIAIAATTTTYQRHDICDMF